MNTVTDYSIKKCPICEKHFSVTYPELWVYKRGSRYLCSWTCLRAFDAKHGEPRQLRKGDALNVRRKGLTLEEKKRAVQECLEGKNPLDYLTSIGVKTPAQTWHDIKKKLKDADPETYAKLPARLTRKDKKPAQPETAVFNGKEYEKMPVETPEGEYSVADCFKGMNDAANEFFGACEGMGLTLDKEPEVTDFVQEVATEENVTEQPETTEETVTRPMQVVAIRSRVRPDCRWEVLADGDMVLCNGGFRFGLTVHQWKRFLEEVPEAMKQLGVDE